VGEGFVKQPPLEFSPRLGGEGFGMLSGLLFGLSDMKYYGFYISLPRLGEARVENLHSSINDATD
jgi:hypothetical protein